MPSEFRVKDKLVSDQVKKMKLKEKIVGKNVVK